MPSGIQNVGLVKKFCYIRGLETTVKVVLKSLKFRLLNITQFIMHGTNVFYLPDKLFSEFSRPIDVIKFENMSINKLSITNNSSLYLPVKFFSIAKLNQALIKNYLGSFDGYTDGDLNIVALQ